MAVGALVSPMFEDAQLLLIAVGGFFGILPDFDLVLSPLWRRAHRSAGSHSLIAAASMGVAWYAAVVFVIEPYSILSLGSAAEASAAVAFGAAFLHAAEDSLTVQGCRLMYPLSRRRWRGPVRYDDIASNAILSLVSVAIVWLSIRPGDWSV